MATEDKMRDSDSEPGRRLGGAAPGLLARRWADHGHAMNRLAMLATRGAIPAILWLPALTPFLAGQPASVPGTGAPTALQPKVIAVGQRFTSSGKERVILRGSLTKAGGAPAPLVLAYETGGKFRYQNDSQTLVMDGKIVKWLHQATSADEAIVESLFDDSMDGIVGGMPNLKMFRLLMNRARMDEGSSPDYAGPYMDIFDMVMPVASRPGQIRQKHYYFDSQSQLLNRVVYLTGTAGNLRAETRFADWRLAGGVQVPGSISRVENGVTQFEFSAAAAESGPAQSDQLFQQP